MILSRQDRRKREDEQLRMRVSMKKYCAAKEQERERQMNIWMKNHKNNKTDE
jgi:hypothetical protein